MTATMTTPAVADTAGSVIRLLAVGIIRKRKGTILYEAVQGRATLKAFPFVPKI